MRYIPKYLNTRELLQQTHATTPPPKPATPALSPSQKTSCSSSTALTALIILVGLFFLAFFSSYLRRHCRSRHRQRPQAPPQLRPKSNYGLDPAMVEKMPVVYYSGDDKEGCSVCLGDLGVNDRVKVIPSCGHAFHPDCIDLWLVCRGSCPMCRCTDIFGATTSSLGTTDLKPSMEQEIRTSNVDGVGSGDSERK